MVRGWRDLVEEDFVYAVKGSRFITHMKKLANLDGALALCIYFNNDVNVRAPDNAKMLMEMIGDQAVQPGMAETPRFETRPSRRRSAAAKPVLN